MITIIQEGEQFYLSKNRVGPIFLSAGLGSLIEKLLPEHQSTIHIGSDFSAPLNAPDVLLKAHKLYVEARAEILTTETFRGFQRPYEESQILRAAFDIARQATENLIHKPAIAISLGPVGDTEDHTTTPLNAALEIEHGKNIGIVKSQLTALPKDDSQAVFLLPETLTTLREAQIIAEIAQDAQVPFLTSFKVNDEGQTLDGHSMREVIETALKPNAFCLGIGVNCCTLEGAEKAVEELAKGFKSQPHLTGKQIAAYPNGFVDTIEVNHKSGCDHHKAPPLTPGKLSEAVWNLVAKGATAIGGCCGAGPEHTAAYVGGQSNQDRFSGGILSQIPVTERLIIPSSLSLKT